MMIDTDVLIWFLRGNENAKRTIYENAPFDISIAVYIEIMQGIRNKKENQTFQGYLEQWNVKIVHINEAISSRAMFLAEDYFFSHSLKLADALIAATAIEKMDTILTGNNKHYQFIPNLKVEVFKP
jgi:predicted nucleic acid-binding protein